MSWDGYRDNLLQTKVLDLAAICGFDGSVWTKSPELTVTPQDVKSILDGLNNRNSMAENGVHINNTKYMYITSDADQVQAKKGTSGLSIAKTKTCLIIGIYGNAGLSNQTPGNARSTVEGMADYLRNLSF